MTTPEPTSETAPLLKSSPASTDQATNGGDEETLRLMNTHMSYQYSSQDDDAKSWEDIKKRNKTKRCLLALAGVLAVAGLAIFASIFVLRKGDNSSKMPSHKKPRVPDKSIKANHGPLSTLDPVADVGIPSFNRPHTSRPSSRLAQRRLEGALPTNTWYQNLILAQGEPTANQLVYTIPYTLDVVGPIPGLRVHHTHISSSSTIIQVDYIDTHGLTIGAGADAIDTKNGFNTHQYSIDKMTPLGITLEWDHFPMKSPIMKGMAYATMIYNKTRGRNLDGEIVYPMIASELPPARPLVIDGMRNFTCTTMGQKPVLVKSEIEMYFDGSDFTWLAFFSEPALVQCVVDDQAVMKIQVVGVPGQSAASERDFVIRAAILKPCTTGRNPIFCHQELMRPNSAFVGQGEYGSMLRNHSHLYPGPEATFDYEVDYQKNTLKTIFDWDTRDMKEGTNNTSSSGKFDIISFGLTHHLDLMPNSNDTLFCTSSLVGPACLVKGSRWTMIDDVPPLSFRAPRPPEPWAIPYLIKALNDDLNFRLPKYFQKGVGDTYFSGKMLAKLSRILLVYEEVKELCSPSNSTTQELYREACSNSTLPDVRSFNQALSSLRDSVTIWLNGKAGAPFVYDLWWGGVASCGCLFNDKNDTCDNQYPNCPGFEDPGLNFGNAFYNDQHFHYGYHIYGAATVAYFDPEWGKQYFQRVLLLIRSIANPSEDDKYFPLWRQKDWYQGHSWASGIATAYRNGRNQESSSESIAAYEAIVVYGNAMVDAFGRSGSSNDLATAKQIREVGIALVTTELRSAKKYYHVRHNIGELRVYPSDYQPHVVGIMWNMMAQFQTWFGGASYFANGIQLMPTTPISEKRDDVAWAKQMYPDFSEQCYSANDCAKTGWSILPPALLATVGHPRKAVERLHTVVKKAFDDPGGNGQSLTNSIWYAATRPVVEEPLDLGNKTSKHHEIPDDLLYDCHRPFSCTNYILDTYAGEYTCRQRIEYLMKHKQYSQKDACSQIAHVDYPAVCGKCDPDVNATMIPEAPMTNSSCPPCTEQQCASDLNRCPRFKHTYVCVTGSNHGGCSAEPWVLGPLCKTCCDLTHCPEFSVEVSDDNSDYANEVAATNCPPCTESITRSRLNLCPPHTAPFLCTKGVSYGGCSPEPWSLSSGQCLECCTVPKN